MGLLLGVAGFLPGLFLLDKFLSELDLVTGVSACACCDSWGRLAALSRVWLSGCCVGGCGSAAGLACLGVSSLSESSESEVFGPRLVLRISSLLRSLTHSSWTLCSGLRPGLLVPAEEPRLLSESESDGESSESDGESS